MVAPERQAPPEIDGERLKRLHRFTGRITVLGVQLEFGAPKAKYRSLAVAARKRAVDSGHRPSRARQQAAMSLRDVGRDENTGLVPVLSTGDPHGPADHQT